MTNLPEIDPQFLRHLSQETRDEIARQTQEPGGVFWFSLALLLILAVGVVAYPIVMVLGN
jgi:hypothetical protein